MSRLHHFSFLVAIGMASVVVPAPAATGALSSLTAGTAMTATTCVALGAAPRIGGLLESQGGTSDADSTRQEGVSSAGWSNRSDATLNHSLRGIALQRGADFAAVNGSASAVRGSLLGSISAKLSGTTILRDALAKGAKKCWNRTPVFLDVFRLPPTVIWTFWGIVTVDVEARVGAGLQFSACIAASYSNGELTAEVSGAAQLYAYAMGGLAIHVLKITDSISVASFKVTATINFWNTTVKVTLIGHPRRIGETHATVESVAWQLFIKATLKVFGFTVKSKTLLDKAAARKTVPLI